MCGAKSVIALDNANFNHEQKYTHSPNTKGVHDISTSQTNKTQKDDKFMSVTPRVVDGDVIT
jgi:hypothetical protein